MAASRFNRVLLRVGMPATGKTTATKADVERHKGRVLVVDINREPDWAHLPEISIQDLPYWVSGKYRINHDDEDELFEAILQTCKAKPPRLTLLVFEDAGAYLQHNIPKPLNRLLSTKRQMEVDMIMMFHTLRMIFPRVYGYANYLSLRKTVETFDGPHIAKIPDKEAVKVAFDKLKKSKDRFTNYLIPLNP
jgi:hypothetical protein